MNQIWNEENEIPNIENDVTEMKIYDLALVLCLEITDFDSEHSCRSISEDQKL